ncbi:MAG: ATP-binding cassette domain-containing protein [Oscillospiraceae bacterium]|jgi:ABC-2 type transport system ATP-binding protein|nr:ATP-binding cassette domain-containing protein [Oscillospiraceae bacterium]MBQ5339079.1 ATP-binding cassette domain-containing protein [Oscillospiraceae bacterium]
MIEVRNLTKHYGDKHAVNDISFTVEDGEILGFLGPNGAGKSTTMNMLTGYISSTSGQALINGVDILEDPIKAKSYIGYLPELPPLYLDMTVKGYLNYIFDLKKCKLPRKAHLNEVMTLTKVNDVKDRIIKNLSKGYKQRVGLAQALIGNPPVLILDEPTVGLDPKQILEIRTLIKKLGKNHTVILSSHILSEIQAVCDRIIIINHGVVAAHDTTDNLSRNVSNDHRIIARIEGPRDEIVKALRNISGIKYVKADMEREPGVYEYELEATPGSDIRRELFHIAAEHDWPLLSARSAEMTLEDVFLKITMGEGIVIPNAEDQAEAKKGEKA